MGKGIDIRATSGQLLFRTFLQDGTGALLTSGTTTLRLYELQTSDATLKSYDFNDNTFKTGALTTATASMTHRTGNNDTVNTGIWTYRLATLTGFTAGSIYFAAINNTSAAPTDQVREFQFGSAEGDLVVTSSNLAVYIASGGLTDASFATDTNKYQAKVWSFLSNSGAENRFVVAWYKNGEPIVSGITSPTIQVIKAADGTDLVGSTAMTEIASTGLYRYTASSGGQITNGVAYMVKVAATIGGSTRTWYQPFGRDA